MSLYNKYRPKSFDELIQSKFGQTLNKQTLTHHAYLFFGPPGTGKTSAARLCMAEFREENEPVDKFVSGRHPDYVEINCAVTNGIDDIRAVVSDVVNTMPIQSDYKFIIFDECHMLTSQAQNALLKTTEEPPAHIKFFFCTTEINKVIPAIRSRCQIIPFTKLNEESLVKILTFVGEGEKLTFKKESLLLISSCSDGSARTAINLFEQCTQCLNDPEGVAQILGTASVNNFQDLTRFICNKDRVKSLSLLDEMLNNAIDPGSLVNRYADYIANQIILRIKDSKSCEFDGRKLLIIADAVTDILKDFKILQNIKLIN